MNTHRVLLVFSLFTFHFSLATAAATCLCGEAPERANDFFWENDRVGFRAYGPGDVHKWSGIDVFNKSGPTNIVVHWLREPNIWGNWHKNLRGLGMDDYAVGPGRGVGGVAFRKDGRWLPDYGNWFACRVLANGEARCAFELDYRFPLGGVMTLAIELRRGSSLFRESVRFSADAPIDGVEVGVGLDLSPAREHVGDLRTDPARGIVSLFEKPHDRPGEDGAMMNAILAAPGQALTLCDGPEGAKMLMTRPLVAADAGRDVLVAYAGADWTGAGRYLDAASWHDYVSGFLAGVGREAYLDIMEAAVGAYPDDHLAAYLADVEREGVQEHGFPRLAANLGVLVANGRCTARRETLKRMMDASCRCAAKGMMPRKSGGNEFSVKELVVAVVALERAKAFPKDVTDAWRADLSSIVAEKSYTTGLNPLGAPRPRNWVVFAAASEQARLGAGMGGDPAFVERHVADQLRWFDENGMYRDAPIHPPAVYDMVTRLQFVLILQNGYNGPSRAKLERFMDRSAEPTLQMLSACGEIPYCGRSNQFLHNNTFYAALCEWYAARAAKAGDIVLAARFRRAAALAVDALKPWLAEQPVLHVKNRYPRESGKGVYNEKADMGCERYAYFDKYMVTMGSWAMSAWQMADARLAAADGPVAEDGMFKSSPDFHFVLMRAGDYSAQIDYNANPHYDATGIGRVQRRGAPSALCLSTPCTVTPSYRIDGTNDAPLAILPVLPTGAPLVLAQNHCSGDTVECAWTFGPSSADEWNCRLTPDGLVSTQTGKGALALTLPAFAFDGRESPRITAAEKTLSVSYRGWRCVYETNGTIVDTGLRAANRNGVYRRFEARGSNLLEVKTTIEKEK